MKLCCMEQGVGFHDITYAIVLGDFGLPWSSDCEIDERGVHPLDHTDRYLLKWYNQKPFKVLAVMGNHDNYDVIEKLPEVDMFGAKVRKVSDNVFYLKRGEIYEIEGKRFLVLGGAMSEDKAWRIPHETWWAQEEWCEGEKEACLVKIAESGGKFDYVLSHTGPIAGIAETDDFFKNEKNMKELLKDSTVGFNDKVDEMIEYKKWFFGHWHSDWGYENKESKYGALYHQGYLCR